MLSLDAITNLLCDAMMMPFDDNIFSLEHHGIRFYWPCHVKKLQTFWNYPHQKIFCEYNYVCKFNNHEKFRGINVIPNICNYTILILLIWRKFSFSERTVCSAQCGNFRNSLSRIFGKKFVKATVLLKKLLKRWFDEIFFQWE